MRWRVLLGVTGTDGVSRTKAASETSHTAVTANMERTMKTAQESVAFGQGNLDAFVKSSQIWAAGVQDLSKSFTASASRRSTRPSRP
jgi:hypothetical protein